MSHQNIGNHLPESACPIEMLVPTYQTDWLTDWLTDRLTTSWHDSEDNNMNFHRCGNLRYCILSAPNDLFYYLSQKLLPLRITIQIFPLFDYMGDWTSKGTWLWIVNLECGRKWLFLVLMYCRSICLEGWMWTMKETQSGNRELKPWPFERGMANDLAVTSGEMNIGAHCSCRFLLT
jgi:hypothetical protein